jgi:hypothetical protein
MLTAVVLASWWAQAQPAPVAPPPLTAAPAAQPAPGPLDNRIAVVASYARQLGDEGTDLGPPNGFGMYGSYERRVLPLPQDFDLSAGVDFFFDKFGLNYTGVVVSQTGFAATAAAAWHWSRLRPYVQVGAGFTIAYAGDLTAVQPLVHTAAGLDIAVTRDIAVTLRVAYSYLFTRPTLMTSAPDEPPVTYSIVGNLLDVGAGVALGF